MGTMPDWDRGLETQTPSCCRSPITFEKAWVSLTQIDNETWLRSVAANPGADPEFVFQQVLEAANIP